MGDFIEKKALHIYNDIRAIFIAHSKYVSKRTSKCADTLYCQ